MTNKTRPGLGNLPLEVLDRIIDNGTLRRHTLKALRLLCHRFNGAAARALFHDIRLSPLNRDRDAFLAIANAPHLACHVRTLVWEEFSYGSGVIESQEWRNILEEEGLPNLTQILDRLTWLPVSGLSSTHVSSEARMESFRPQFEQALLALTGLKTVYTRPIHPSRRLQLPSNSISGDEYSPILAHHVLHHWRQTLIPGYNRGFFGLLAPAFANLAKRHSTGKASGPVPSQINHLNLLLDVVDNFSGLDHNPLHGWGVAFANLTHLDICMSGNWNWRLQKRFDSTRYPDQGVQAHTSIYYTVMGILEHASQTLTHLHLCAEIDRKGKPDDTSMLRNMPHLRRLKALDLCRVHHEDTRPEKRLDSSSFDWDESDDRRYEADEPSALVDFIRRHASTLCEVYVSDTPVYCTTIAHLCKINGFNPERFEVVFSRETRDHRCPVYKLSEAELLEVIYTATPENLKKLKQAPNTAITTRPVNYREDMRQTVMSETEHLPYWSHHAHETRLERWGHEDREHWQFERTWEDEWGHEHEYGGTRVMVKPSRLWEDENGDLYDPFYDRIVGHRGTADWNPENEGMLPYARPDRSSSVSPEPWWKRGDRTWDRDVGLWKSPTGWHRFAVDQDTEENEETLSTILTRTASQPDIPGDDLEDDEEATLQRDLAKAEREHFSHLRRLRASQFWDFGRSGEGDDRALYYKPGYSFETQVWLFKHRNGDEAYGTEPLDFFSDWEGSQAGDICEPTPYGWNLRDSAGHMYETLDEISPDEVDEHGRSWIRYHEESDPMAEPTAELETRRGNWLQINDFPPELWLDVAKRRGNIHNDDGLYCINGLPSEDSDDTDGER